MPRVNYLNHELKFDLSNKEIETYADLDEIYTL